MEAARGPDRIARPRDVPAGREKGAGGDVGTQPRVAGPHRADRLLLGGVGAGRRLRAPLENGAPGLAPSPGGLDCENVRAAIDRNPARAPREWRVDVTREAKAPGLDPTVNRSDAHAAKIRRLSYRDQVVHFDTVALSFRELAHTTRGAEPERARVVCGISRM